MHMHFVGALIAASAATVAASPPKKARLGDQPCVPSLNVPACPDLGSISYTNTVPSTDNTTFPKTEVALCYDDSFIHITFTALGETAFYYNASVPTNGDIYDYEVMEAFIYKGTNDPQTYLEFEVAPNNVTFSAFIYNPSKVRAAGAAFDRFYITDLAADALAADTTLKYSDEGGGTSTWVSRVQIPLGLFSVDGGGGGAGARGTAWRMNFFRTTTNASVFPAQGYGGWSPPNETNFHMTPFFGHVYFV